MEKKPEVLEVPIAVDTTDLEKTKAITDELVKSLEKANQLLDQLASRN